VKYVIAFLALLVWSSTGSAQDIIHTTDGIFYCHGDHPRCSWPDQSTYPYYQFSGQHVGQMSGVSDLLPDGPALPQYQSWLTELISLRPGTNAVASWSDAESKVDGGRVWGGFISARSELPDGADSQLIGLEVDVLNDGLPGVYPNYSKVGLQVVGFGAANTNAIEVLTQTPSAAFQNIINIQPNSIAADGAVIGMAPQHAGRGIDFRGSTFADGALLLSPNQKIVFQIPGLNDAAIYRDQFSNGYLVLQAGTPGLRITNAQDTANLMIITPDGNFVTPLGSFSDVLSRLSNLESKSSTGSAAVPASAAQVPAAQPQGAFATNGGATAAATGSGSIAGGAGAVASADHAVALGNSSTASADQSTAVGYASQATGTNSVALGANSSDGGQANVVSVGSASQTRRLVNVAAGVNGNDAVNLGQLNDSLSQAAASARAYTDERFTELSYDLNNVRADLKTVRHDAEGATASAMALAGIPQTIEPGKGMVGVGVGTWQGQSAIALGISKATDDGRFVLKAGATYNSRSQGGANAGMGWAF
jgi:hypothetical protein